MNVGFVLDLRNPVQRRVEWSRVYGHALEICEEADRLGAHSVWVTEHHGFDDGYIGQPLQFLTAVAARTTTLRLGTSVMLAPIRSAADIAEQAVVLDAISDGRLELGLGAGYRKPEFEHFATEAGLPGWDDRFKITADRIRTIQEMWADGTILPAPTQQPIPIWAGFGGPVGARRAGRLGVGLLSVRRDLMDPYLEGLDEGGHDRSVARMGGFMRVFVTDDPERDWPVVSERYAYMYDSYNRHAVMGTGRPVPPPVDVDRWRRQGIEAGSAGRAQDVSESMVFTTPEDAARQVLEFFDGMPVETIVVWLSPGVLPEEMAMRHVQLLATELQPRLAAGVHTGHG